MCKFESSQKDKSEVQSPDPLKAYSKLRAFSYNQFGSTCVKSRLRFEAVIFARIQ